MNNTSSPLLHSADPADYWNGSHKCVLFVHNWRTAGTTMHSLLAANIHDSYIKVGDSLNRFGKFKQAGSPGNDNATLREIRLGLKPGSVLAGHLAVGVESLLPGQWDCWMSAREPIERVRSGLLRFHSRAFKTSKASNNLIDQRPALDSPESVANLLNGSLLRESNGMCRRLASFSTCKALHLSESTNLEKADFLEAHVCDQDLFSAARQQLSRISCLILAEELLASIVCLEKHYGLPPLINPFSSLKHNSSKNIGYSEAHLACLNASAGIIRQSQQADLALWPLITKQFKEQLRILKVKRREVVLKKIIHSAPLFDTQWFDPTFDANQAIGLMADALVKRSRVKPELAEDLINNVCRWPGLATNAQEELRSQSLQILKS